MSTSTPTAIASLKASKLQIHVKHHKGNTSKHGLKQLIAVDNATGDEKARKEDAEKRRITLGQAAMRQIAMKPAQKSGSSLPVN